MNVHTADPLLFHLENDPGEWHNLAGKSEMRGVEARLKARTEADGWDPQAIEAEEFRAQTERLFVQDANEAGDAPVSWDCQPYFDASKQYSR